MATLEQFGDDIWIVAGPDVASAGFRYPTRMAVMRLASGELFVWSPIALSPDLCAAVDALGEPRFVVTPTKMHHLSLSAWRNAYPRAILYAAPGSRERSPTVAFDDDLHDRPALAWESDIDQAVIRGNVIAEEVVFFHRKSGTVLFADLLQNFPPHWFGGVQALVARLDGMIGPAPRTPNKFRLAFTDRKAARASFQRVLDWPAQRVLMVHGDPVNVDGAAFIARAFAWLL